MASTGSLIVQAGDSIGGGPNGYAAIDHLGFDPSIAIHNVSFAGETMVRAYFVRGYNEGSLVQPSETNILLIELGTNDLGTDQSSATDLYSTATAYIAWAKSAGFYVALITILPRSLAWTPAQETQRLSYNTLVRQNAAGADAIVDWAADPLMGDGVNPTTSPYYADGLHPTVLGQNELATLDAAALKPLLGRTPR